MPFFFKQISSKKGEIFLRVIIWKKTEQFMHENIDNFIGKLCVYNNLHVVTYFSMSFFILKNWNSWHYFVVKLISKVMFSNSSMGWNIRGVKNFLRGIYLLRIRNFEIFTTYEIVKLLTGRTKVCTYFIKYFNDNFSELEGPLRFACFEKMFRIVFLCAIFPHLPS